MRTIALIATTCIAFGASALVAPINATNLDEPASDSILEKWEQDSQQHTASVIGIDAHAGLSAVLPSSAFDAVSQIDPYLSGYYFYSPERDSQVLALPADYLRDPLTTPGRASESAKVQDYIENSLSLAQPEGQVQLRVSRFTSEEIDGSMEAVQQALLHQNLSGSIDYDPWTDSLEVGISSAEDFALPDTDVPVHLVIANVSAAVENNAMPSPFRGGGALYAGGWRCTSGIPAYNASGTPGIFTAGHCFSAGNYVYSDPGGSRYAGRVTHTFGYSSVDAQFISGAKYTPQVYTNSGLRGSKRVVGTYHPTPSSDHRLCFTGSTTGVVCNNYVTGYKGAYCDNQMGVCFSNLITLYGGTSAQDGDSGGTTYANFGSSVKVTGMVSGMKNPLIGKSTTYVVDWRNVAATYAARLML